MSKDKTTIQSQDVIVGAVGLYPTGPYDAEREYGFLEIVSLNGQTYFAMHGKLKGIDPESDKTMEHWFLVAARGESLYQAFVRTCRFKGTEDEFLDLWQMRLSDLSSAAEKAIQAAKTADTAADNANKAAGAAGANATAVTEALEKLSDAIAAAKKAGDTAVGAASAATKAAGAANSAAFSASTAASDAYAVRNAMQEQTDKAISATTEANTAAKSANDTNTAIQKAEETRVAAEAIRVENEKKRASEETNRANAEQKRATGETNRAKAETLRADEETKRVAAETARSTAETTRVSEFQTLKDDVSTAISNTNKAKDNANAAAASANKAAGSVEQLSAEVKEDVGKQDKKIDDLYAQSAYAYNHIAQRRHKRGDATPRLEAVGNIEYLKALPSLLGLGCYLVQPDRSKRKLDPSNHLKFDDGTPAKLDGTMGDYMWCWNAFYYAWWWEGDYYYEAVSLRPILGRLNYYIPAGGTSALGAGVMDRENNILCSVVSDDPRYRGGNNDPSKDGAFNSLLGKVASAYNAKTASEAARKKGIGWEASWFITNRAVEILYRIIMGTRHCQEAVNPEKDSNGLFQGGTGMGCTTAGSWWGEKFKNYPFIPTSFGVDKGDYTGELPFEVKDDTDSVLGTVQVACFFGLKNFYGHIGNIENGIVMNKTADGGGDIYVAPSLYAPFVHNSLDGLIKACHCPANDPKGWLYISEISMQNLCGMPTECKATPSTGYGDGFYNDNVTSGLRGSFRRGCADCWNLAGLVYFSGNVAVLYAYASWSLPLCFLAEDASAVAVQY